MLQTAFIATVSFQDSVWYLVAGGSLTFLGGVLGPFLTDCLRERTRRKQLLSALRGEIASILFLIELRKYIEGYERIIAEVRNTKQAIFIQIPIKRNYFEIYQANLGNIGLLPAPFPEKLVCFYRTIYALLESLDALTNPPPFYSQNIDNLLNLYAVDLSLLKSIVSEGQQIVSLIGEEVS